MKALLTVITLAIFAIQATAQIEFPKPDTLSYKRFIWKSQPPKDCPFEQSKEITGIAFSGIKSGFHYGDTWYPTWADDDRMYSPWTDGKCWRLDGSLEESSSVEYNNLWTTTGQAVTGQAVIEGDDPLSLKVYSLGIHKAAADPYHGRYPAGSLVYNKVWYYGTYYVDLGNARYGDLVVNWPWLGPFVGFRYSTDYGRTWNNTPHTPAKPLFGENGINGYPVKIGTPHFVDFGKNMQYSPDGKAYLFAHGADTTDTKWRFWNASWITGDQIYLLRVTPSIENMNDASKYEFYAGKDIKGNAIWTNDFKKIKPLMEWNNNMGCVTVTYNAPLKKYIMSVTDGGNTTSKMNTYILESSSLTGTWKLITYMKNFGEQAYFVNFPSKFISADGKSAWMMYSGNFTKDWKEGSYLKENPPGSHYGMVLQKIEFLTK
jgi:hypothetical protein